jgi:putative tricarboxylic transport membrane protein
LREDLPVLPVVLGLITLGQLGSMLSRGERWQRFDSTGLKPPALTSLSPVVIPTIIGGVLGSTVGAVPGLSGYVSARLSRTITLLFGRSDSLERRHVRGLAANESAQNAAQAGEMVPTLGLGIPGSDSMVLVLAALSLQNLTPGPFLLTSSPELLSATIAALLVGALVLLPTGWILGRMLLKIVSVDQNVVLPIALFATFVGVYITRNDTTDVVLLICLGLIGAVMTTHAYPTAVTAIAFVLADGAETNFRQGILLVESDLAAFVGRPWVALILFASAAVLALGVLQAQSASPSEPPRHV